MAGTFSRLLYHIVFSTKQRTLFIDKDLQSRLYPYLEGVVRHQGGWLLALNGMPDHVHLLVRIKTDVSVAEAVRVLKANSSKWVHGQPDLPGHFAWQSGYAAFSVSESQEGVVRAYILNQEEHHRKKTFEVEHVHLLKRHNIEFDPAYLD